MGVLDLLWFGAMLFAGLCAVEGKWGYLVIALVFGALYILRYAVAPDLPDIA